MYLFGKLLLIIFTSRGIHNFTWLVVILQSRNKG
jgi:hypothetical protein